MFALQEFARSLVGRILGKQPNTPPLRVAPDQPPVTPLQILPENRKRKREEAETDSEPETENLYPIIKSRLYVFDAIPKTPIHHSYQDGQKHIAKMFTERLQRLALNFNKDQISEDYKKQLKELFEQLCLLRSAKLLHTLSCENTFALLFKCFSVLFYENDFYAAKMLSLLLREIHKSRRSIYRFLMTQDAQAESFFVIELLINIPEKLMPDIAVQIFTTCEIFTNKQASHFLATLARKQFNNKSLIYHLIAYKNAGLHSKFFAILPNLSPELYDKQDILNSTLCLHKKIAPTLQVSFLQFLSTIPDLNERHVWEALCWKNNLMLLSSDNQQIEPDINASQILVNSNANSTRPSNTEYDTVQLEGFEFFDIGAPPLPDPKSALSPR